MKMAPSNSNKNKIYTVNILFTLFVCRLKEINVLNGKKMVIIIILNK